MCLMRIFVYLLAVTCLTACKSVERADENPRAIRANAQFTGEIPNMLRGTIKQHVALMGYDATYSETYEPMVAAGYGLVIGLDGTGSNEVPPQVRAHMLADLARRGLGESTRGWGNLTPAELLESDDTSVVIVEAIIPQAATGRKPSRGKVRSDHSSLRGTTFDLRVFAEPSSGTTSLEGGQLPVNCSGGVLSSNPIGASGMIRFAEAALQVRGMAGEHQVDGAKKSLKLKKRHNLQNH